MNAFERLFAQKPTDILSVYFTAGYPALSDTTKILQALTGKGADMVEIGMPYSDPLADGPVIQNSSMKALQNGMSISKLFEQLSLFDNTTGTPLVLMGYLNPVLQYGFERFCQHAAGAGISGIILPDLPLPEFEKEYKTILEKYDLHFIFLVTPETSEERIRKIDALSSAFIYAVSSSSVTGKNTDLSGQEAYFQRLQNLHLKNKILVGFGIRDHDTFKTAARYTAGGIIGTAYIRALENDGDISEATKRFFNSILKPAT